MRTSDRSLGHRPIALLIGLIVVLPVVGFVATASPVTADFGSDGVAWPDGPRDVQGVAFIGTALEVVSEVPEPGMRSFRFGVDEVLDGAVGATIDVTPWCVGTRFVPGRRYLVSTSDTLPLPGVPASSPTPGDGHAWFTDPTAVAWRVADDGSVRLLRYGEGAQEPIPAWLRDPTTVREAVRAVLPNGGDPDPVHPAPTPTPTDPPGVTHEPLGSSSPDDRPDVRIELSRTTLAPGASVPATRFTGDWFTRVESGTLTVTLVDGSADVLGPGGPVEFPTGLPRRRTLGVGDALRAGPGAVLSWENRGAVPVSVLSAAVLPYDAPSLAPVDPAANPEPRFDDPVMRRTTLTGPGETGDRYRITIADRSARVIGARVPTVRDLRFAGGGDPPVDYRDIGIGPVAYLGGNVRELLVWWTGTPCGPVVTVDVAQDLSAVRVVDRTGGCDAAGVRHALALRIRGEVPDPAAIEGSWVRRR